MVEGDLTSVHPSKKTKSHLGDSPESEHKLPVTPLTGSAPGTPVSNKMDSEDDFMSGNSSGDDFDNIEDSDDGLGKVT